ncbi:MAG: hypothetical protein JSW50_13600 [Candidatus Latescibacterota bacterium]|nr:MAG: hypothetical protein JSW50_13600 [Candidatus Latescibacterota bacterium]
MASAAFAKSAALCIAVLLILTAPVSAQLRDQLSAYTGLNATGYVEPLVDAFAADLSAGLFHSAYIPEGGLQLGLEILFMSVAFSDEDRTFRAITEGGFYPEQITDAPTVVGQREAVYVDGDGGTQYAFPGGFDVGSLSLVVPQLRIGSLYGTEALIRFALYYTGGAGVSKPTLYGIGGRHSVSQHLGTGFPIEMALSAFWQRFSVGDDERSDDLVTSDALSVGIHLSKTFGAFEPYTGVSYESFSTRVYYEGDSPDDVIDLTFETDEHVRMTLGLSLNVAFMTAHGEYNFGGQNSLAVGLALHHQFMQ